MLFPVLKLETLPSELWRPCGLRPWTGWERADGLRPWPGICSLTGAEKVDNTS